VDSRGVANPMHEFMEAKLQQQQEKMAVTMARTVRLPQDTARIDRGIVLYAALSHLVGFQLSVIGNTSSQNGGHHGWDGPTAAGHGKDRSRYCVSLA
jgi:hypothetical protein